MSDGHLFVADNLNGRIGEYTTTGETVKASLISGLTNPGAVAVSGEDLFVASFLSGTIGKYNTSGKTVDASLITGLTLPTGIAVSGSSLFVVNNILNNNSVSEYTTSGETVNGSLISGLTHPIGIVVSTEANVPDNSSTFALLLLSITVVVALQFTRPLKRETGLIYRDAARTG